MILILYILDVHQLTKNVSIKCNLIDETDRNSQTSKDEIVNGSSNNML